MFEAPRVTRELDDERKIANHKAPLHILPDQTINDFVLKDFFFLVNDIIKLKIAEGSVWSLAALKHYKYAAER